MSFAMSKWEREVFLSELHVGVFSVAAPGRGPVTAPVWYMYEPGGEVRFCTDKNARKLPLIKAAGRFSLCVQDERPPYKYVTVEGPVVAIDPCGDEVLRPIARRYLGQEEGDAYVASVSDSPSVLVRMRPERWSSADFGKPAE